MDYDSLFCSKCGVKYIKYNDNIFASDSMPVAVVQWEVFLDEGKPFICIKICNIQDLKVIACMVRVKCKDIFGDPLEDTIIKYYDLKIEKYDCFGEDNSTLLVSKESREFEIHIEKVVFDNGIIWENDDSMKQLDDFDPLYVDIKNNILDDGNVEIGLIDFIDLYDTLTRESEEYYTKCRLLINQTNQKNDRNEYKKTSQILGKMTEDYLVFVDDLLDGINQFYIPEGIKKINDNIFLGLSSKEAGYNYKFELSVDSVERYNRIKGIVIALPYSLEFIGDYALREMTIKEFPMNVKYIGRSGLESAVILEKIQGDLMTSSIGRYALFKMEAEKGAGIIRISDDCIQIDSLGLYFRGEIEELIIPSELSYQYSLGHVFGRTLINKVSLSNGDGEHYKYGDDGCIYYHNGDYKTLFWYNNNLPYNMVSVFMDARITTYESWVDYYPNEKWINYYTGAFDVDAFSCSSNSQIAMIELRTLGAEYITFPSSFSNLKAIIVKEYDDVDGTAWAQYKQDNDFEYDSVYSCVEDVLYDDSYENGVVIAREGTDINHIYNCINDINNAKGKKLTETKYDDDKAIEYYISELEIVSESVELEVLNKNDIHYIEKYNKYVDIYALFEIYSRYISDIMEKLIKQNNEIINITDRKKNHKRLNGLRERYKKICLSFFTPMLYSLFLVSEINKKNKDDE